MIIEFVILFNDSFVFEFRRQFEFEFFESMIEKKFDDLKRFVFVSTFVFFVSIERLRNTNVSFSYLKRNDKRETSIFIDDCLSNVIKFEILCELKLFIDENCSRCIDKKFR